MKALPAWVDLRSGNQADSGGNAGLVAISAISRAAALNSNAPPDLPVQRAGQDFFPSALAMLARVAWQERQASRAPDLGGADVLAVG